MGNYVWGIIALLTIGLAAAQFGEEFSTIIAFTVFAGAIYALLKPELKRMQEEDDPLVKWWSPIIFFLSGGILSLLNCFIFRISGIPMFGVLLLASQSTIFIIISFGFFLKGAGFPPSKDLGVVGTICGLMVILFMGRMEKEWSVISWWEWIQLFALVGALVSINIKTKKAMDRTNIEYGNLAYLDSKWPMLFAFLLGPILALLFFFFLLTLESRPSLNVVYTLVPTIGFYIVAIRSIKRKLALDNKKLRPGYVSWVNCCLTLAFIGYFAIAGFGNLELKATRAGRVGAPSRIYAITSEATETTKNVAKKRGGQVVNFVSQIYERATSAIAPAPKPTSK